MEYAFGKFELGNSVREVDVELASEVDVEVTSWLKGRRCGSYIEAEGKLMWKLHRS